MPGLTFSNELISRDEGMHCDFAALLYSMLHHQNRLTDQRFKEIMMEAIECENYFVKEALPVELIGMNSSQMIKYIEFVANRLCLSVGHLPLFEVQPVCPFDFMETIGLPGKTNFFEKRVSEYAKANVGVAPSSSSTFVTDAEF